VNKLKENSNLTMKKRLVLKKSGDKCASPDGLGSRK
jgi:hypothetical protein